MMNPTQYGLHVQLGVSADNLTDKIADFVAAGEAKASADANLTAAGDALNAAWTDFVAREASFASAELVAPPGYTPPA
jgi:hypothetical protein